jgi:glyoxylase-like metal-dependent hydrolase (beta-lactamase superfamily II)
MSATKRVFTFIGAPLYVGGDNGNVSCETIAVDAPVAAPGATAGALVAIHALSGFITALYVAEYRAAPAAPSTFLLLDGGIATDFDRVAFFTETVLRQRPVGGSFGLVVATHAHVDHVGSTGRWAAAGVPVTAPAGIDGYFDGAGGRWHHHVEQGLASTVAVALGRALERPMTHGVQPAVLPRLTDGARLPGFADWRAIHVPGHTAHMVALYHAATRTLYAADLIIGAQSSAKFFAPAPVDIPFAYAATLARVRRLDVRWLLLAHGGVVETARVGGFGAVLDQVEYHLTNPPPRPVMAVLGRVLMGKNSDAAGFALNDLPRGALPATAGKLVVLRRRATLHNRDSKL